MSPAFVKHPLIKENVIEYREYQNNILNTALEKNTLCVLPTGLGKTPIAVMLTAHRLYTFPESKALILAPTRPLAAQHYRTFIKFLNLPEEKFQIITGTTKPEKREMLYKEKTVFFATPQTIKNDIQDGRLSLKNFSLLVIDETHHAIGGYAYPYIVERYLQEAENQRILGLTASPGGDVEKIAEICKNAGVESIEIRTEHDEDVIPYVMEKKIEWIYVELPESFRKVRNMIQCALDEKIAVLRRLGITLRKNPSRKDLLTLQSRLRRESEKRANIALICVAEALKLEHAITLLETQGVNILESYWKKLRSSHSKIDKRLVSNRMVSNAMWLTQSMVETGAKHPKISKLCSVIYNELKEKPDSKIIIFANYRNTVKEIVKALSGVSNARPVEFVGQKEGMTQKEQIKRIKEFSEGKYNILVATSVAEEGMDIEKADTAIFYEPVPSGIRFIQRRGRVGRHSLGKIIVLITKKTRDEVYYWSAVAKEREMKKTLYGMKYTLSENFWK